MYYTLHKMFCTTHKTHTGCALRLYLFCYFTLILEKADQIMIPKLIIDFKHNYKYQIKLLWLCTDR